MSANKLNQTKYNSAANNTVLDAVIDPVALLAWRQDVKAVADQHADEINLTQDSVGVKRQSIINGNFSVNQRVKSGTVTLAAGAYGHDRWKAGAAGCTYTFATVDNVTTITITAGSLVQVIEGINLYSGTYTLTWTGTAQGKIGAGAYGATGITGTVVGGVNLSIEFNVGTLSVVQFNFGSSGVPFQPRSFAEELELCQRYYEKSFSYATAPADNVGTSSGVEILRTQSTDINHTFYRIPFRVAKRSTPTVTLYNPSAAVANKIRNFGAATDIAGATGEVNDRGFRAYVNGTSVIAQQELGFHWSADSEL